MDSEEEQQGSQSELEKQLVAFFTANIVGIRFCAGELTGQEMVSLVREPVNPYDSNAIKVINTRNLQVGYIERAVAAVLSPLIDANHIAVEAFVRKSLRSYKSAPKKTSVPCQVNVYAHLSSCAIMEKAFSKADLGINISARIISHIRDQERLTAPASATAPAAPATATAPAATSAATIANTTTSGFIANNKNLNEIFRHVFDKYSLKNQIPYSLTPPSNIIKSDLLEHQKTALGWLFQSENCEGLPPFWKEENGIFIHILTDYRMSTRPDPLRGGIFADEMGLGKTLTLLSLISLDKTKSLPSKKGQNGVGSSNATLIVCPPSVISNWTNQLEQHCCCGAFKSHIYYGEGMTKTAEELGNYDLVLTAYSTLATELQPGARMAVKKVHWRRVILDEAHTIKNFKAAQTQAIISLKAKRRWAVAGSTIHNGYYDAFSLMAFLEFVPFSIKSYWQLLVQRHLNQGSQTGLYRLQVLLTTVGLRRTKQNVLVGLPPKTVETRYIQLSCEERRLYDEVKEETRSHWHSYSSLLSLILRLRQICNYLSMCPEDFKSYLPPSGDIEDASKNPKLLETLIRQLRDCEDVVCAICIHTPTDIVITDCTHIFCRACILKAFERWNSKCPLCQRALSESDLFLAPPELFKTDTTEMCTQEKMLSTKVSTLIKLLTESRDQNPATNCVVFSQFRKMLLLLQQPLEAAGFKTLRLDGTMNNRQRSRVIENFQASEVDRPLVLLASLSASSAGINLTAASRVYLMEPWWNIAFEEQAVSRVHRIGQREAVKVFRLIAQNSIEERLLVLQERKKDITRKGSSGGSKDVVGLGIDDLRFVLGE